MGKDSFLTFRKWTEFIVSRAVGTIVDTGVLWFVGYILQLAAANHPDSGFWQNFNYWGEYWVGPAISFEIATFVNFIMSYFWIWRNRITDRSSARTFWRHFWGFNISCIFGFIVKMIFLVLCERIFHWDAWLCNLAAVCVSGILNYFLAESVVFRKRSQKPEHELLSIDELGDLAPVFSGSWGRAFGKMLMAFLNINKCNRLYNSIYGLGATEASDKLVQEIGCKCLIGNAERLDNLPEGAFITISNHPYGHLDGILLLDIMLKKRPDFKVMVNQLLGRIEPLKPALVTVNPTTTEKKAASKANLNGVRETLQHLQQGHPMGFFPSGAVSDLHIKTRDISDRQWQDSLVRLIKKVRVPIIPIRFADRNSMFYYLLGLIDWKVRLLRLPSEVFNKHKGVQRVIVGSTISVEEQDKYSDIDSFREFLRSSVYATPIPDNLTPER